MVVAEGSASLSGCAPIPVVGGPQQQFDVQLGIVFVLVLVSHTRTRLSYSFFVLGPCGRSLGIKNEYRYADYEYDYEARETSTSTSTSTKDE